MQAHRLPGLIVASALFFALPAHAALSWVPLPAFSDPRTSTGIEGSAASLIGGKIYVSHGHRGADSQFLSVYDIGSGTWTHGGILLPNAAVLRSEMASGTVGGKHYAFGGRGLPGFPDLEVFDPGTSLWSTKAPMPTARGGLGGATWGGLIYALGGRTNFSFGDMPPLTTNEVYDPVTDAWSTKASMPVGVADCYACVGLNGKVYVFGGATDKVTVTNATQIYDIASDTWSLGAPMPTPRGAAMAGVLCDGGTTYIAVFGGFDGFANLTVTELYNPSANTWSPGPPMPISSSEIAQGMVWDPTAIYSIGSGMYGPSFGQVFALKTNNSCFVTALEVAAFVGRPASGSVTLTWTVSGSGAQERLDLLRGRTATGSYSPVATGLRIGAPDGAMSYVDRSVEPGTEYFYRLAATGDPSRILAGPVRVTTLPSLMGLSVRPSPATRNNARVAYSLARPGGISMELIGVDGSRVRTLMSGDAPAGAGELLLNLDGVPSGIYFVRLRTAYGSKQARLVLLSSP